MKQKSETGKSPLNSTSIRSPMGKYSTNTTTNNTPATSTSIRPSRTCNSVEAKKVISFTSPTKPISISKAKTPESSKNKEHSKASSSSNKVSSKAKSTTSKKRKINDLENTQNEIKANIEKLKKDHAKFKLKLVKAEEDELKQQLKFPIKDEDLKTLIEKLSSNSSNNNKVSIDTSAYRELKPLPLPVLQLSAFLQPDDIIGDAIGVWDFLNVFSKTLSLVPIPWEDFVELLNFTGKDSLSLNDIFCSLLKIILSDSVHLTTISNLIPRKIHFASRMQQNNNNSNNTNNNSEQIDFNIADLLQEDDFDCDYNGLKFFPRKLKADSIDVLKLPALLRGIILRLQPVRRLRKAVLDITNYVHRSHHIQSEVDNLHELDDLVGLASGFKRYKTKSFLSSSATKVESSSSIKPAAGNNHIKKDSFKFDKDTIFQFTSDVSAQLKVIYEAVHLLESHELYELEAKYKIAILKVLCDTCYDAQRIKDILERNADERAIQIQNMSKQIKDQKAKQKEASLAKKDVAFQACRKINKSIADEEAARISELEKKSTSAKKKTPNKQLTSEKEKNSKKSKNNTTKGKSNTATSTTSTTSGGKDGYDPTPEQLNAMIEELMLLESIGIDVVEDIPIDEISDDEANEDEEDEDADDEFEYDSRGNLIQPIAKRSRRVTSQMRMKALDRKRINDVRRAKQLQLDIAQSRLNSLLTQSRSERDLRAAIKNAEKNGCRGININGKTFCTPLLKQAYVKLNELEVQAKEDKINSMHERTLQEYFVRTMPIGKDRFNNQYWVFNGDDSRLFVQLFTDKKKMINTKIDERKEDHLLSLSTLFPDDKALQLLYKSRSNRYADNWGIYSSAAELWQLWDSLDDRGEREYALKAALKARFDIQEPAQIYLTTGSDFIGRKVKRVFGKRKPVIGLIVGWLPTTDEDDALWHVQHLDGDEEDLYESEVLDCIIEEAISNNNSSNNLQEIASIQHTRKDEDSTTTAPSSLKIKVIEQEEPNIVRNFNGLCKGTPSWRSTYFPNSFGLNLLKSEITRTVDLMKDELKHRNAFTNREARKCWEMSLRDAVNISQVNSSILELEEIIRSLQVIDDKQDAEEALIAKQLERQQMAKEGWLFENNDHDAIGKHARRFFKGFGKSDGVIVAYLPENKNDGTALFHMEHSDGDAEDLNEIEMSRAIHLFVENIQEDDEEQPDDDDHTDDGSDNEDQISEPRSESIYDQDEDYRSIALARSKTNSQEVTLWPTAEVRNRWQLALKASQTVGEVGLALQSFTEQVSMFGMIPEDNNHIEVLPPRSARARNGPSKVLSPLKSKFNGRENLSRAATRTIRSYAE